MNPAPHELLAAAMTHAGISFEELWITYFTLGGMAGPATVRSYLGGAELS